MPTSSVTEVYTEERQKGIANFRATRIGDTTHLTMAGLRTERLVFRKMIGRIFAARLEQIIDCLGFDIAPSIGVDL